MALHAERFAADVVRRLEGPVRIAAADDVARDVRANRLVNQGTSFARLVPRKHGRKVINLVRNQGQSIFGDVGRLGDDHGDGLADVSDLVRRDR